MRSQAEPRALHAGVSPKCFKCSECLTGLENGSVRRGSTVLCACNEPYECEPNPSRGLHPGNRGRSGLVVYGKLWGYSSFFVSLHAFPIKPASISLSRQGMNSPEVTEEEETVNSPQFYHQGVSHCVVIVSLCCQPSRRQCL